MKARQLSSGAFLFGFAVAVGAFVAQFSWNGVTYFTDSEMRDVRSPAAIRRDLDFSLLNGAELVTASQKRLITAARTVADQGEVGLELRGVADLSALAVASVGGPLSASAGRASGLVVLGLGTAAGAVAGGTLVCINIRRCSNGWHMWRWTYCMST